MRRTLGAACVLVLVGCSSQEPVPTSTPTAAPTSSEPAEPSPTPSVGDVPALADAPAGDMTLWLDTIGIPVVAAIRTSTQLARLGDVPGEDRAATCRQVAADLDAIAAPELLTGIAITADAETATLLVGDLQAKGELLATCEAGGPALTERIAEVERTHAVAVAWLERLRGER